MGAGMGSKVHDGATGVIAVVIVVIALVGAKYVVVGLSLKKEYGSESQFVENELSEMFTEEITISYVADKIIYERTSRGESVEWPDGVDPEAAAAEADYAPDIWAEAERDWRLMRTSEKNAFRDEIAEPW